MRKRERGRAKKERKGRGKRMRKKRGGEEDGVEEQRGRAGRGKMNFILKKMHFKI